MLRVGLIDQLKALKSRADPILPWDAEEILPVGRGFSLCPKVPASPLIACPTDIGLA